MGLLSMGLEASAQSRAPRSINYIESLRLWLRIHAVASFSILILFIAMGAALGHSIGIAIGSLLGQLYAARTYGLSIDVEKSVENLLHDITVNLVLSHTLGNLFECVWILILALVILSISRFSKRSVHRLASLSILLLSLTGIALSIVFGFLMQNALTVSLEKVKSVLVEIFSKYLSSRTSIASSMIHEVTTAITSSTSKTLSDVEIYNTVLKCVISSALIIAGLGILRTPLSSKVGKLRYLSISLILFAIAELLTNIPHIRVFLGVATSVLYIAIGILDWITASELKRYAAQLQA